jgi:molybdopterin synthase sulfur carrier subunit
MALDKSSEAGFLMAWLYTVWGLMKILFFAQVKSLVGATQTEWHLDQPLDVEAFWKRLLKEYPQLLPLLPALRVSKNLEFAAADTRFEDHDEAAIIPPVSGG